jgi:phage protein D/phage baseplate assembly protein gpV
VNPSHSFEVSVNGSALHDEVKGLLESAYVDESLNLPDLLVLTFRDPDRIVFKPSYGLQIGASVTIKVVSDASPSGETLIQDAEITALEAEHDALGTVSVVRGLDKAHRLFRGRTTKAYANASYSDVARQVAQRHGIEAGMITATSAVHDVVSQVNVSDWEFLLGLAAEVGYEVTVVAGKLNFGPPPEASAAPSPGTLASSDPLQLSLGDNLLRFRAAVTSAEQVTEVQVRSWDPKTKKELVGTAPAKASQAGLTVTPGSLASKFGSPVHCATATPFGSQSECESAAKALAEDIGGAFATVDGVAIGNIKLKAGSPVSLGLVGAPFDGKYTLTTARHLYDPDEGYLTWFTVSPRHDRTLLGLTGGLNGQASAAAASASGKPIPGVTQAIVTNAKDPENLCRVKVKFPWLSDDYESDWARTAQVSAGNGYGAVIVPEVGDEVLVAFEQGDFRRPYVLAGLYNGMDKPPAGSLSVVDDASGKVQRRDLFSRTHHRVSLTEKDGTDDGILISTGDDKYQLQLSKNNQKVTLKADGTIEISAEGTPGDITITAAGNLNLKGRQIRIKADSGIQMDGGGGNVEIKGIQLHAQGTAQVSVKGATISVQADATAEFKGGAMVQVQGALVKIN